MSFGAGESWLHDWEPPETVGRSREVMVFAGHLGTTPEALAVAETAVLEQRPLYIRLQRPWRLRLWSWPWRPWRKWEGPAVKMAVSTGDGQTFILQQIP